jgi:hypothetical protein
MIPQKKSFLMLLLLGLFVSCGNKVTDIASSVPEVEEGCPEDESLVGLLESELFPLTALPSRELKVQVVAKGFVDSQMTKINQAIVLLSKVVNSYEFRERIYNYQYLGQSMFASTDLTNVKIYEKIMTGKEQLSLVEDQTLNIEIRPYYNWRSVVAYTTSQSTLVNFNTKFLNYYSPVDIAKTLMHEWLHKIGFNHDFSATSRRPYSVPYGIGEIVRVLAKAP